MVEQQIPPFPPKIPKIKDGESVEASIANRAPAGLVQRTDHLKALLDLAQTGQILVLPNQPLASNVLVNNLVFRDTANNNFQQAIAALEDVPSSTTGLIELADSNFVWGIAITKEAGFGDILLAGALPATFDFTDLIEDDPLPGGVFAPGAYFLSSRTAGKATKQPKIAGLFQFFLAEDGSARFLPAQHGILEAHIHQTIDLIAEPAGLANCVTDVDDTHEITQPDSSLPGWLPADDPVFGAAAPVGAKFGYNVAKDAVLSKFFPPIPLEGTFLQKNGITVPKDDLIIDNSGIWWLKDDFGNVPWPVDIDECDLGGGSSSSTPGETDVELRLFMTEFLTKTGDNIVTRLRVTDDEQNIELLNEDGSVNTTGLGSLRVRLDLNLTAGIQDATGPLVVKEVDGNEFKRGPVVEKVVPGPSGRIQLRNIDTSVPQGQGTVEIEIAPEPPSPEEANLNVVRSSPSVTVTVQPGSTWFDDGNTFVNVPTATLSPTFNGVSTGGKARFDLLQLNVEDFLAAAPTFLEIVQGAEVSAPGDPFDDAPAATAGKLLLAIIRVTELVGLVDIADDDITNLKTINRVLRASSISDLRQDGLDASGAPSDAGSLGVTGAPAAFIRADHSAPTNTSGTTPVKDGTGTPGAATTYARSNHEHPLNTDPADPQSAGVASPGTASAYARSDHIHPSQADAGIAFLGATVDSDKLRVYQAAALDSTDSQRIKVNRSSPLDVLFDGATTNSVGNVVYSTGGAPEALRLDRWYAIYLIEHPTMGINIIASLVYKKFDNIRPAQFAAETIPKGDPPMPAGFEGSKFARVASVYLKGDSDIRLFEQANGIIYPKEVLLTSILTGSPPASTNTVADTRFGCPPGASAVRLRINHRTTSTFNYRVFRSEFGPGTPPDVFPNPSFLFTNRGKSISAGDVVPPFPIVGERIFSDYIALSPAPLGFAGGPTIFTGISQFMAGLSDPEVRSVIFRTTASFGFSLIGAGLTLDSVYEDPSIAFASPWA